jgi:hypothetical protein
LVYSIFVPAENSLDGQPSLMRNTGCNDKMTIHKFIAKLNWRQVVIHFIATWFFTCSFQTLAILHDTNLVDVFTQGGGHGLRNAVHENKISASDITYFVMWTSLGNMAGLLLGFIISLIISFKRKWFWFNSFLVLVLVPISGQLHLLGWAYLKKIFLMPGEIFANTTWQYLTDGLLLLSLGLLTFFLASTNKFITMGHQGKDVILHTE